MPPHTYQAQFHTDFLSPTHATCPKSFNLLDHTNTPSSLISLCRFSFPIIGLKISSLPSFALKSPNRIFILCLGIWLNIYSMSSLKLCFESSPLSPVDARAFRPKISHQWPFSTIYEILSLTNSLNCWYYSLLHTKILPLIDGFHFLFHIKKSKPLLIHCLPSPT